MPKLRFLKEANDDFIALDGSQKKWVRAALERLEERGGEIGEPLGNHEAANLHGFKKIKNRKLGLRIIFRENREDEIEIIEIIVIGRRDDLEVYRIAGKRIQTFSDTYAELARWMEQMPPK